MSAQRQPASQSITQTSLNVNMTYYDVSATSTSLSDHYTNKFER